MDGEYSLLTLPASALMLLSPTVAPARPCSVPSEVREFMAPAAEPAVVPAVGTGEREQKEGGRKRERRRVAERESEKAGRKRRRAGGIGREREREREKGGEKVREEESGRERRQAGKGEE